MLTYTALATMPDRYKRYQQRAINFAHAYALALHGKPRNKASFNSTYRCGLALYYRDHPTPSCNHFGTQPGDTCPQCGRYC